MGYVLAAQHLDLREPVAIKFLLSGAAANPDVVERFLREARAALRIKCEHVVRVMDIDRLDDGTPFIVMEHLDGHDQSAVRKSGTPLPFADAVDYVLQACEALGKAHRLGIIHRDIKPANLFLTRRGDASPCVKVLDFGISKLGGPGDGDASVTKTNAVMGTAEYMSPEQMRASRDVDGRTDIWALGVVLYELCTARAPFRGETLTAICASVLTENVLPPHTSRPDMPPALEAAILRCLEKDRERRYGSMAELAAAIAPFATQASRTVVLGAAGGALVLPSLVGAFSTPGAAIVGSLGAGPSTGIAVSYGPRATGVVSSDSIRLPRSSHRGVVLGALAVVLLGALAALAFGLRSPPSSAVPVASSAAESAPVPAAVSPHALSALPVAPAVSTETAAIASAPAVSATAAVSVGAPSARVRVPGPATPGKATVPVGASCDPPYVMDAKGLKRMKPQCL